MLKKYFVRVFGLTILCGLVFIIFGCNTGVEISPNPGILRVTLQSDPVDTLIVIKSDTFKVSKKDSFAVTIFQGRAYSGSNFAVLYKSKRSYKQEDVTYNIIRKEDGGYKKYIIFESYIPPFDYDRVQFGITASLLKLKNFEIPVQSPENANLFIDLYHNFQISENRVTEINVQISPFKSLRRYRDAYHFIPDLKIINVKYY